MHGVDEKYKHNLFGKFVGKRPFSNKDQAEKYSNADLKRTGCENVDWIHLARDGGPVTGSCEHGDGPSGRMKCGKFLDHMRDYKLPKDPTI
jgi:hypothetical protein